ncbi:hypothetical protein QAD02_011136 [Eretmocerus hayati]|uniref:Uncharacterized protein n=1 Tax=Eretmocerus hayati TaxID=131215 RepID=A0ACC2NVY3_9HYME|nr:hypothetical protein QAD02_011136 [Eretmocerus hayati]
MAHSWYHPQEWHDLSLKLNQLETEDSMHMSEAQWVHLWLDRASMVAILVDHDKIPPKRLRPVEQRIYLIMKNSGLWTEKSVHLEMRMLQSIQGCTHNYTRNNMIRVLNIVQKGNLRHLMWNHK